MPIAMISCAPCLIGDHEHHEEPPKGWHRLFVSRICPCKGGCTERVTRAFHGQAPDYREERP